MKPSSAQPTSVAQADAEVTDEEIELAKQGDAASLGKIFRVHNAALVRYLRGMAVTHAEDVAGQTWVEVASSLHRFHGNDDGLRRWIFTIARRRMIDVFRSQRVQREQLVAEPEVTGSAASADAWLERLEWAEHVLAQLPQAQAEVVLLRAVAGFSVEEVAMMIDKSEGAVRLLAHRGLQKVLDILADEETRVGRTTQNEQTFEPVKQPETLRR